MTEPATDDPTHDLIQRLFLEVGRIMEDFSADLAITLPHPSDDLAARVTELRRAAWTIAALADAADALIRTKTIGRVS